MQPTTAIPPARPPGDRPARFTFSNLFTLRPERWREDLLNWVLRMGLLLGAGVCVPSVILSWQQRLYGLVALDVAALAVLAVLTFTRGLPYRFRATGFGVILFIVGFVLTGLVGPGGKPYLLGCSVLMTVLLGLRSGVWTVGFNALGLLVLGVLAQVMPETVTHFQMRDPITWAVLCANMLFINAAVVVAVGPVLATVQRGLDNERSARASLEEREALLRMASRLGNLGAWRVCVADGTLMWSEQLRAIFKVPLDHPLSVEFAVGLFHPEDRPTLEARLWRCTEQGESYDVVLRIYTLRGELRWTRAIGEAVRGPDGTVQTVHGTLQDVTDQMAADQSLRESEARFRTLCAAANDAIFDWDVKRDTVWWNEHRESLFGAEPEPDEDGSGGPAPEAPAVSALGAGLASWSAHVHPDDRPRVLRAVQRTLKEGGDRWTGECRFRRANGGEAHVLNRVHVLRDAEGRPERVIGWVTDLTDRKRLEDHLLRAQRMESIGTLAGGIAHDLNNVLTPITASISFLESEESDPEKLEDLRIMKSSARRGADMIRQLLSFARGGKSGTRVQVDVALVAKEVLKMVRETFPRGITATLATRGTAGPEGDEPWPVLADPTQLHQVLTNLCVNARDAMPRGGQLTLTVEGVTLDEGWSSVPGQLEPGPWVRVRVEDTGTGMTREVMDRVFEPFFTTKELGKGTGLGLATCHTIIRNLGGAIHLYSEPGRGTRFEVYLPADLDAAARVEAQRSAVEPPRGRGECVLLAEDEEGVRTIAARTLERNGYRVLCAENGEEAVSLYRRHMPEVALVLTDMNMPLLDGPGTIAQIRALDPRAVFVAASGLRANESLPLCAAGERPAFLEKPYTAEALLTCVREALRGAGSAARTTDSVRAG